MKKLIVAALLGSVALQPTVGSAASDGADFTVNVDLISACSMSSPTTVDFNYTSFGGAVASTGGDFNVTCTNGLAYTFTLDAAAGVTTGGAGSISNTLLGLNYTLTAPAGGSGSAARQITGSMIAGQAGTCAGATCNATAIHSLIITY